AAPGLFSTMKGWPSCSVRRCATVRAMTSVALPAVSGTTMRTGLSGQVCAVAAPTIRRRPARTPEMTRMLTAIPHRPLLRLLLVEQPLELAQGVQPRGALAEMIAD